MCSNIVPLVVVIKQNRNHSSDSMIIKRETLLCLQMFCLCLQMFCLCLQMFCFYLVGAPAKVPFLIGDKISSSDVKLNWKKPLIMYTLPITSYVIKTRNQRSGETKASVVDGRYTFQMIRNLHSSSAYIFSIAAVNNAGKGEFVESPVIDMSGGKFCIHHILLSINCG